MYPCQTLCLGAVNLLKFETYGWCDVHTLQNLIKRGHSIIKKESSFSANIGVYFTIISISMHEYLINVLFLTAGVREVSHLLPGVTIRETVWLPGDSTTRTRSDCSTATLLYPPGPTVTKLFRSLNSVLNLNSLKESA